MSVETALYAAIVGDGTINALIGTRCYPVKLPDNVTFPAVAYGVISQNPFASNGCTVSRIQVDCYAASYSQLKSLRDGVVALANASDGWWYASGSDIYQDDAGTYHQPIDIMIHHEV